MNKFLSLSYHYIRPPKKDDKFPRILGNRIDDFADHIKTLGRHYNFVSPKEVEDLYVNDKQFSEPDKIGLLLTFDDGLSDHYNVAKMLSNLGIKAFFFIPTCIVTDGLPANPNIIHYCLAKYGVGSFIVSLKEAVERFGIKTSIPKYTKGDDVWTTISEIKKTVKYNMNADDSRKVLLYVYENLFRRDHPNSLEIIHLSKQQIKEMAAMGHSIGSHSHSHFSVASGNLSDSEIRKEIISPKSILEKNFGVKVSAFSYPFGEFADCLKARDLLALTNVYNLAFTIEEKLNTANTSPLELGRYVLTSKDTPSGILKKLLQISEHRLVDNQDIV